MRTTRSFVSISHTPTTQSGIRTHAMSRANRLRVPGKPHVFVEDCLVHSWRAHGPALEQTSHSSPSATQIKRDVAETPQIGREVAEGGSAVDTRRVDGGSLHSGASVARAGAQLKSTGVAEAVHRDETRVRDAGGLVSRSAGVVGTGPFIKNLLHNHSINIK